MQVRNIPLADIAPSELNPRKTFNQEELEELAQNIKENGLVQPITLRKAPKGAAAKFEIVCGERRFRASQLIGATDIQAIVKDLDDKQAFACMIIENLQRKDIDPMEEAAAFNKLHKDNTMTVGQMAKLLGKSTSFVLGRIQLHNTIPEFVQLMRDGILVLTHLLDICKLTEDQQKILFESCFTEACRARWTYKFPNMPQLHEMIDEHVMNYLEKANFSLTDDTFACGQACESCPLNTKNNPESFNDANRPRCMKRECFVKKCQEAVFRKAKELKDVQLVYQGEDSENADIVVAAKEAGLELTPLGKRNYVLEPVEPNPENFQDKECYEKRLANYRHAKSVFEDNVNDGTVVRVFEICFCGQLSGEEKYVFNIPQESLGDAVEVDAAEVVNRKITALKDKLYSCEEQRRDDEIERHRAFLEQSDYSNANGLMSKNETLIFLYIALKRLSQEFKQSLGLDTTFGNYTDKASLDTIEKKMNQIKREFIKSALSEKSVLYSRDMAHLLDMLMGEKYTKQKRDISKSLDEHYESVKSSLQAKIDNLKGVDVQSSAEQQES